MSPREGVACGRQQGPEAQTRRDRAIIGGSAWAGISAVFGSRYLLGISTYVLLLTVTGTFIYFTRLQMVAALGEGSAANATGSADAIGPAHVLTFNSTRSRLRTRTVR